MPFDGALSIEQVWKDAKKAKSTETRLKKLIEILEHPEFPEYWKNTTPWNDGWDYTRASNCALGVSRKLWGEDIPHLAAYRGYFGAHFPTVKAPNRITPKDVAAVIRENLV